MNLREWQDNWDALGKDDPLWVILTDPTKKGGRWDPKDFFATGETEINHLLQELKGKGHAVPKGVALDFGCGVGRLTQALAAHFETVHGIDISPSMIEHANRLNRYPEKVQYHVNGGNRLEAIEDRSVDFIYSNIVLQHIEPRFSKVYVQEFMRVLRPGGLAVFQMIRATLPRKLFPESLVVAYRNMKHKGKPYFGMFGVPEKEIIGIIEEGGGKPLEVKRTPFTWRWISMQFVVRKQGSPQ